MASLLTKIFGSRNDRLLKKYRKTVKRINALEAQLEQLPDDALRAKTPELRQRYEGGETLEQLLPEAFAVVREAAKRTMKMRHFDVQLIGGIALHEGKIAEMSTGEGKTLTATLSVYLNALAGKGVHVVTVNDYLAKRDAAWMQKLYNFLGLQVGVNLPDMSREEKQAAYNADITYGTNNEFGFDYLRDNMVYSPRERVQRGLAFAIVDEVDSILIDEARTPLIISGQAEDRTDLYLKLNHIPPLLTQQEGEGDDITRPGDYTLDLKSRQVLLTEQGHEHVENLLAEAGLLPAGASLYDPSHIILIHHLYAALRAHSLFHKDQHYVVQNNEVIIVDEFTGRLMAGRRWSEGLHQAVEAKEGVEIRAENQTLASITFQNYFRMYDKLAGMTGTADTEAFEFHQIYGLETVIIPTNRPMCRQDHNDKVYRTAKEKWAQVIADIQDCVERGQPVLVGTTSIEINEFLSGELKKRKMEHQVLNAKQHDREAAIVAQAGRPGVITIATNMAGRGTDIVLGGNIEGDIAAVQQDESLTDEQKAERIEALRADWLRLHDQVLKAGGLHIIGTERHESRRIDNQLRGRAGRQGDPGSSRFYLSVEDPLMKIFGGERLNAIMVHLKLPEGEATEAGMVTRSLESAQRKVEQRNFDIRKQLLEYDDVANDQRHAIYKQRNEILDADEIADTITAMRESVFTDTFRTFVPADSVEEQWDIPALEKTLASEFLLPLPIAQWLKDEPSIDDEAILKRILDIAAQAYADKISVIPEISAWRQFERNVMLQSMDTHWREHIAALDHLRQGIHLRGYAQKNPKQEYKREAFELFGILLENIQRDVTKLLFTVQLRTEEQLEEAPAPAAPTHMQYRHDDGSGAGDEAAAASNALPAGPRPGRNEPCPCGSGKKYKHCHGKLN